MVLLFHYAKEFQQCISVFSYTVCHMFGFLFSVMSFAKKKTKQEAKKIGISKLIIVTVCRTVQRTFC